MALFFNLKTLQEQAGSDNHKFIAMLHLYWDKSIPLRKSNMALRSRVSLVGHSYLLNPKEFFEDKSTDIIYRVQYLKLAGMRDYSLYKQYKYIGLQTSFFPDLAHDNIKHNPLLIIKPTEILFKYERN